MTELSPVLDKDDVKAIRNADTICFRYANGTATVECIKKDRDEFGEKERRRDITVLGTVFNGYDEDMGRARGQSFTSAFVHFGSAQYHEGWRTIAQMLRTGDQLRLEFRTDDATNGYVKDAKLHADLLYLRVERAGKRMFFLLDVSVCPDNTARMVQP